MSGPNLITHDPSGPVGCALMVFLTSVGSTKVPWFLLGGLARRCQEALST